jgi:hypothetical protein
MGILPQVEKYVHMNKNNKIVSENTFHLLINIVGNNDIFCFTLQHIEITMYWCIMPLCIMLCYHHESHDTYVLQARVGIVFQNTWTRGFYVFKFMVIIR